jgi:RNA polymerase sigma factor for flagellar operon FliA
VNDVNTLKQYRRSSYEERTCGEDISRYLPLVRYHAGRLMLGLPAHVSREDLIQAGVLGLMEAMRRYDPSRGIKFETFASRRIRGAMLDELRNLSWLPRSLFKQMRELDKASQSLASRLGREPEEEEIAGELGVSPEKLHKIRTDINCSAVLSLEDTLFAPPAVNGPEVGALENIIAEEEKERLARAIKTLPERHQQILALYYQEKLTLKEIGLVLGVTESRVCQLHSRIISRLRALLADS